MLLVRWDHLSTRLCGGNIGAMLECALLRPSGRQDSTPSYAITASVPTCRRLHWTRCDNTSLLPSCSQAWPAFMVSDTDSDDPFPFLARGRLWDGLEDWTEMAVVLKEEIDGPDGLQPACSSGHYCRACRATLPGEQLGPNNTRGRHTMG
jgi:hypothetical protein